MLRLGIVGLPNVGKSTLFNALTNAGAAAENFPFCTVDPNVGVVPVPDERLDRLAAAAESKKVVPATVEFVDIAGLVKGASQGEGLGNKFLSNIREVDAIVHVVRCFDDPDVVHVMGPVDPARDHDIITAELALADLAAVERRIEKVGKTAKSGDKTAVAELQALGRFQDALGTGKGARDVIETELDRQIAKQYGILTAKPILYAANVGESEIGEANTPIIEALRTSIREHHEEADIVLFSAKFEAELSELSGGDRKEFLEAAGIDTPGLDRLIFAGYKLLGLETFFTVGPNEARAWTIPASSTAFHAAGEIHSDFQRGFIRAETIHVDEFLRLGSYKAARDKGAVRSEGRDYVVKDGDVLLFRFNV